MTHTEYNTNHSIVDFVIFGLSMFVFLDLISYPNVEGTFYKEIVATLLLLVRIPLLTNAYWNLNTSFKTIVGKVLTAVTIMGLGIGTSFVLNWLLNDLSSWGIITRGLHITFTLLNKPRSN